MKNKIIHRIEREVLSLRKFSLIALPMITGIIMLGACSKDDDHIDTVPPAEVTNLSGIAGNSKVTLNWTDPEDSDFGSVEISYPQGAAPIKVEKGAQTATITGLTNGTDYTYTVKTVDATGNRSVGATTTYKPLGIDPNDLTPPAEIMALNGIAGSGQVTLNWADPTDADFTKVSITYSPNGTTPIEIGKGAQTAVSSGLTNGTSYVFTLKTIDINGNQSQGVASAPLTPVAGTVLATTTYNLNGVQFKMIAVDGGTFTMGCNACATGSGTQVGNQAGEHQVTLTSYLIGETEVTRALWNEVMNGSHSSGDLNYPVASITIPDSRTFVQKLNQKAHAANIIPADRNFYIPSEAQWEFASKGGNSSNGYTYSGSNTLSEVGWTSSDGSSVHAVKQKAANELGIYDMSGNVYEWVADYAAPYFTAPQTNPINTTPSSNYIKRGGSFYYNDPYRFTSTYRYFYSSTDHTIGLRIALY